jgi:hypothetical protein
MLLIQWTRKLEVETEQDVNTGDNYPHNLQCEEEKEVSGLINNIDETYSGPVLL